jgi:hypothetical protein
VFVFTIRQNQRSISKPIFGQGKPLFIKIINIKREELSHAGKEAG